MKRIKLFPKTFLHCLFLMVSIILLAFFLLYLLMPPFYRAYQKSELNGDTDRLVSELETISIEEIPSVLISHPLSLKYNITASDENGEAIYSMGMGFSLSFTEGYNLSGNQTIEIDLDSVSNTETFHTTDGHTVSLTLTASVQQIDDAVSVLLMILPIALFVCVILSAGASWLYAKTIVKPIQKITETTVQMRRLDHDASCDVQGSDEISVLSQNINEMYEQLLSTISNLEKEIQTVAAAEQEKLDFLLLASHELKTPVTAVRGMVDGMIYNVGAFKDRDTYLRECQKNLEELSELLCRILEASRMDLSAAAKEKQIVRLGDLLREIAEPYEVIAQSCGIQMEINTEQDFSIEVSKELLEKALSNVFSNAVKYTNTGGEIHTYIEEQKIILENECKPLTAEELAHIREPFYRPTDRQSTDSTGLGLYFTDRILTVCCLPYRFTSYEKGMRFIIDFGTE